jgi:hypothetical protein
MNDIKSVKARYTMSLMEIKGVVGVGIGKEREEEIIVVMVKKRTRSIEKKIPPEIEGYKISILITGEIKAL